MNAHWLFPTRLKSINPDVIIKREKLVGAVAFEGRTLQGKFFRVSPTTPAEIFAIQRMEPQQDKFAPLEGDGIIVTREAMARLDALAVSHANEL